MLSYPGLIRFGDGVSIEVFPLIARLWSSDFAPLGQRFRQAECRAERSSRYAEARKRRRTAKAFESNSKGIE